MPGLINIKTAPPLVLIIVFIVAVLLGFLMIVRFLFPAEWRRSLMSTSDHYYDDGDGEKDE